MPNWITLQFYAPMPNPGRMLSSMRFTGPGTNCVITTTRQHGFESAQIGFPERAGGLDLPGWLPEPLDAFMDFADVRVRDGAGTLFRGRASKAPIYVGGRIMGVTAAGYWDALFDNYYTSSDDTPTTSGAVIRDILTTTNGYIGIDEGNWTDPGVSHACSEFDGQRSGAAIQTLLNEGNGTPVDLQLWDGPNGQIVASLRDRTAPAIARYAMDWIADTRVVSVTYDPQQLYGHYRVRHTAPGASETVTTWNPALSDRSFADIWRVDRSLEINGGQMTDDGAEQLRDTTYALQSVRQWGGTIMCSALHPLLSYDGVPVRHAHVRSGEWLVLRGLTERNAQTRVMLQIQQTVYDTVADTLQLTVSQGMTLRTLDERIINAADALSAGRNPNSGARTV